MNHQNPIPIHSPFGKLGERDTGVVSGIVSPALVHNKKAHDGQSAEFDVTGSLVLTSQEYGGRHRRGQDKFCLFRSRGAPSMRGCEDGDLMLVILLNDEHENIIIMTVIIDNLWGFRCDLPLVFMMRRSRSTVARNFKGHPEGKSLLEITSSVLCSQLANSTHPSRLTKSLSRLPIITPLHHSSPHDVKIKVSPPPLTQSKSQCIALPRIPIVEKLGVELKDRERDPWRV